MLDLLQVLAEVEAIHALGVSNIFVVDDNFIGNKKDTKALLAALADWQEARNYPVEFMTEVSPGDGVPAASRDPGSLRESQPRAPAQRGRGRPKPARRDP